MIPRAEPSFEVDLFGNAAPAVSGRLRKPARPHPAEVALEEFRESVAAALHELSNSVEDSVEEVREALARVEIVDGGGDVDCALDMLDEAVTDALNALRRDIGAW